MPDPRRPPTRTTRPVYDTELVRVHDLRPGDVVRVPLTATLAVLTGRLWGPSQPDALDLSQGWSHVYGTSLDPGTTTAAAPTHEDLSDAFVVLELSNDRADIPGPPRRFVVAALAHDLVEAQSVVARPAHRPRPVTPAHPRRRTR